MDNRRLILAIVLAVTIMFGWQVFAEHMGWIEPAPVATVAEQQAAAPAENAKPAEVKPIAPIAQFVPSEGREVHVDTPLYEAVFHSGGGVLQSFKLKKYDSSIGPGSDYYNMVSPAAATVAPWACS